LFRLWRAARCLRVASLHPTLPPISCLPVPCCLQISFTHFLALSAAEFAGAFLGACLVREGAMPEAPSAACSSSWLWASRTWVGTASQPSSKRAPTTAAVIVAHRLPPCCACCAMQVFLHYLPHFKTVPEPAASTADELLLRSCVPAICLAGWCLAAAVLPDSLPDCLPAVDLQARRLPRLPACLPTCPEAALSSHHCCRPTALCFPATCCRRDALSPEALAIVSYDTRQQDRRTGPVRGVRANLQQAISDVRWAGRAGWAGWEGKLWGGRVAAPPPPAQPPVLAGVVAACCHWHCAITGLIGMSHGAQILNGTA
jgi:hypothetical protein